MRVVVFKFNNLGDNVVFVPVMQALRRHHPDAEVTLLTTPNEAALYEGPFRPHRILTSSKWDFDKAYRRPWRLASWAWTVKKIRPDACLIAFDQGTVAHLVAKLSGAKVRIGANLEHIRVRGSLTEEIAIPDDRRPVTWNWKMGQALARYLQPTDSWEETPPAPNLRHLVHPLAQILGPKQRVVVHPGASRGINQWSEENFATVASALSREYEVVWITHGKASAAPSGTRPIGVTTLDELASWIDSADLFLGNNSGPMHLANALGCPGVAVTGPSAAGWDPYWNPENWTPLRHPDLYCAPCEKPNKQLAACANLTSPMACFRYWTPEKVVGACILRLEQPRRVKV